MSTLLLKAEEVAAELCVSKTSAYKVIKQLNAELEKAGYMTITGKVNREYFYKRFRYDADSKK